MTLGCLLAFFLAAFACGFPGGAATSPGPYMDAVPAQLFARADYAGAGRALALSGEPLVLSNSPEFPREPGILVKVDDVGAGRFRVLYSHDNLLYDPRDPRVDDPATVGLAVVNHTGRPVSLFRTRWATVRTADAGGSPLVPADYAPAPPGGTAADYGGLEGATLVAQWFKSGDGVREYLVADLGPGGIYFYHEDAGPGSWAMGLFDLVVRDRQTGEAVSGKIGVEVLIARRGTDFASFYRSAARSNLILPADATTPFHQRGLFSGADRTACLGYAPGARPVAVQLAQRFDAENSDPAAADYQPDMFVNDVSADGRDGHPPVAAQDSGDYGMQYVLRIRLSGPAAVAVAPAGYTGGGRAPVDMYDQHLVFDLDGDVQTLSFRDPRYADYYRSPFRLFPPGWGRVVYTLRPGPEGHTYTLRTMLPPNGYGPFTVMVMPASGVPVYRTVD